MLKELRAKITADASRFKHACDESIAKTRALARALLDKATGARASERQVQMALEKTERQIARNAAAAKKANAASGMAGGHPMMMAVAAGAAALAALKKAADYVGAMAKQMDAIGKQARNLGTSSNYFQKMQYAAEQTGTSFERVQRGFAAIKNRAADAANGNAAATKTFHDLGISIAEIRTLSPEALFDRVTSALRAMDDPLQRDALSAQLFGARFTQLNNFVEEYLDLGEQAEAKGLIIKDEEIAAAEELSSSITNLQKSLTAAAASMGIISFLNKLADGINKVDEGLRALKNNPAAMAEAGITEKDNRTTAEKWLVRYGNYALPAGALFMAARRQLGMEDDPNKGFGDYLWEKLHPDKPMFEYSTAPVTRADMDNRRAELKQQREETAAKKLQEEENKRALEREKRAADFAKLRQGLQQLRLSRQGAGGGSRSERGTQLLASAEGQAQLRQLGQEHYLKVTGELLPPGAAADLQYITAGLQLIEQLEQADKRRAQAHKRIGEIIAEQNASEEQRERLRLQRELADFAAAGASKEALARFHATRIADITKRAQERRAAQELAQLRAENNRLILQIDKRNKELQRRLSAFRFSLEEGFDPNESGKKRRQRVKTQKLDEGIARKVERQERGANVHYSRAELARIKDYERLRRRLDRNEERIATLREEPRRAQERSQRAQLHRQRPQITLPPQRRPQRRQEPRLIAGQRVPVQPASVPAVNVPGVLGATGTINQTSYMPVLSQIAAAVYRLGEQTYIVRGGR